MNILLTIFCSTWGLFLSMASFYNLLFKFDWKLFWCFCFALIAFVVHQWMNLIRLQGYDMKTSNNWLMCSFFQMVFIFLYSKIRYKFIKFKVLSDFSIFQMLLITLARIYVILT